MILLGGLVALWGGVVLAVAPGLHAAWKRMHAQLRRDGLSGGLEDGFFGTRFLASERGLRWMRIAGGAAVVGGLAAVAVGLARSAAG